MQEHLFQLGGTSIFGVSVGHGPLVVCMHGITGNAYVFEPILDLLKDSFHLVSIDQRGHGRSGRPEGYRGSDFASDAAELVKHLDCGPAILLGHSLGARNAYLTANTYPESVCAIVALDFTPFVEPEVLDQLEARVRGGGRSFIDMAEIETYLADRYPLLPPDAIRRRANHGYAKTALGWFPLADVDAMGKTAIGLKADLVDAVSSLRQRTILVRGAQSKLVSPTAWERTLALRPDLEAVEVQGSDHYLPEVKPKAVADIVMRLR